MSRLEVQSKQDSAGSEDNPRFLAPWSSPVICVAMPREEIEKKMDELSREYHETHDPEIPAEIYRLARQLMELEH
jgi:hypothetical protein